MLTNRDNIIAMDTKRNSRTAKQQVDLSTIGSRLRFARKQAGLEVLELAALCGWDSGKNKGKSRISNYENNIRKPAPEDTKKMCSFTGFPPTWITYGGDTPSNYPVYPARYPIPILSPSDAVKFNRTEALDKKTEKYYMDQKDYENCYGVRVTNDLMEPRFKKGDILVIDPQRKPQNGNLIFVHEAGTSEGMFKKYEISGSEYYLHSIDARSEKIRMKDSHKIKGVLVKKIPASEDLI